MTPTMCRRTVGASLEEGKQYTISLPSLSRSAFLSGCRLSDRWSSAGLAATWMVEPMSFLSVSCGHDDVFVQFHLCALFRPPSLHLVPHCLFTWFLRWGALETAQMLQTEKGSRPKGKANVAKVWITVGASVECRKKEKNGADK